MKLFWSYEENPSSPLNILKKVVKDNKIQMTILPKHIDKTIGKSKIITLEELEKVNTGNLENVIFEFQPSHIFKINYKIVNRNLEDIFFNPISEHRFSYCSAELTEEEYLKIMHFIQDKRVILNRAVQDCIKNLITACAIFEDNLKTSKKVEDQIREDFLKNIKFINKTREELKLENYEYLGKMEKELTEICSNNKGDIETITSNFMEDFHILNENIQIKDMIINLIKNFQNLEIENRKKEIEKTVWKIWLINEKEIVPFLCSDEEEFTEENIYNKLKKYTNCTTQKINIFFDNTENFNLFEKQLTYEDIENFLIMLDSELMLNYLKLFLFCCRPNEFITGKEILNKFIIYDKLKKYIEDIEINGIVSTEIKELLFNAKIKKLLLIFEEKILCFSKESILSLKNEELEDLRKKSYFDILDEYVNNELALFNNMKLIYKELYTLNDFRERKIIRISNKLGEVEDNLNLYNSFKKESEKVEQNKQNSNYTRKDVNKDSVIVYSYLKAIEEFAFSNLKRVEIYYRLILLNILFSINEKDLEKYMKEQEYVGENYLTYFKALKNNKKNLGEYHLEYILDYLNETNKVDCEKLIFCINFLHIYSKNLLTNIFTISAYEEYFPFYKEIKLEELISN